MTVSQIITIVLLASVRDIQGWPEGTFGLPMPKTGCPVGAVVDWETGSRTQRTEKGSHASDNVHLAGIEASKTDYLVQLFCMKMTFPQEGDYDWMPGKYCIFKKGDCPARFSEGYIYWDDNAKWFTKDDTRQNFKGVLPDGEYNQNTKIYYCCRNDGSASSPIYLPSSAPFYLLKFGETCQEVDSMFATEEWVYWADESTNNFNSERGVYPRMTRSKFTPVYTKLYYCYYQPRPPSQILQSLLTAVYVIAAIIGTVIIVVVVVCIVVHIGHRCRQRKCKRADGGSNRHHGICHGESSASQVSPTVECQYVTLQTNETAAVTTPSAPPTELDELSAGNHVIEDDLRPVSLPPSYEEVVGLPVGYVSVPKGNAGAV